MPTKQGRPQVPTKQSSMLALVWNSRVETNVASLVQTPNSVTMNKSLLVQLVPAWAQLARGTGPMAPRVSVWAQTWKAKSES